MKTLISLAILMIAANIAVYYFLYIYANTIFWIFLGVSIISFIAGSAMVRLAYKDFVKKNS